MTTLAEIQAQIAELQKKAQEIRNANVAEAVAKVRGIVEEFGLTTADIFPNTKAIGGIKKAPTRVAPKYRDPVSGSTWTGRGIAPKWIGDKDKSEFLIAPQQ